MRLRKTTIHNPARVKSLRSRWNRAFALLTAMVLLSGLAGLVGVKLVVDDFRGSAVRAETQSTAGAHLRAEIVASAIVVASPITATWQAQVNAAREDLGGDFARAIALEDTPAAKTLLQGR